MKTITLTITREMVELADQDVAMGRNPLCACPVSMALRKKTFMVWYVAPKFAWPIGHFRKRVHLPKDLREVTRAFDLRYETGVSIETGDYVVELPDNLPKVIVGVLDRPILLEKPDVRPLASRLYYTPRPKRKQPASLRKPKLRISPV